jgi:hypothetical protein
MTRTRTHRATRARHAQRTHRATRARHAQRTHTGAIRASRAHHAQPSGDIKHTGGRNAGGGHLYARLGATVPTRDPPL